MTIFILIAAFIIIALINLAIAGLSSSERANPVAVWSVYLIFILGGIWGMHSFHLRRYFWGFLIFILSLILISMNLNALETYWNSPINLFTIPEYSTSSQTLFSMLIILLLSDFIGIPYYTYRYNNIYYRRYFETDAILKGEELEIEKNYKELSQFIKETTSFLRDVNKILKDDEIINYEEKDTSIWTDIKNWGKNVITTGKSSKLEKKMNRLQILSDCCAILKNNIGILSSYNKQLSSYLEDARITSYRNLFLAKELIFIGRKKVKGKKQTVILDSYNRIDKIGDFKLETVEDINFESELFFSNMGASLKNSLDGLNKSINIKGDISKNDLINVGIDVTIDTIFQSVEHIINMNKDMKEALIKAEENINKATQYIEKSIEAIMLYKASLLRQSEILLALVKCNKAFITAYEPMREKIFGKPTLSKFLLKNKDNKEYLQSVDFKGDIQFLINLCSEYNKVNQSKVIN